MRGGGRGGSGRGGRGFGGRNANARRPMLPQAFRDHQPTADKSSGDALQQQNRDDNDGGSGAASAPVNNLLSGIDDALAERDERDSARRFVSATPYLSSKRIQATSRKAQRAQKKLDKRQRVQMHHAARQQQGKSAAAADTDPEPSVQRNKRAAGNVSAATKSSVVGKPAGALRNGQSAANAKHVAFRRNAEDDDDDHDGDDDDNDDDDDDDEMHARWAARGNKRRRGKAQDSEGSDSETDDDRSVKRTRMLQAENGQQDKQPRAGKSKFFDMLRDDGVDVDGSGAGAGSGLSRFAGSIEDDEREIASLEKKLGMKKSAKSKSSAAGADDARLPESFKRDGLDYVLDGVDDDDDDDDFSDRDRAMNDNVDATDVDSADEAPEEESMVSSKTLRREREQQQEKQRQRQQPQPRNSASMPSVQHKSSADSAPNTRRALASGSSKLQFNPIEHDDDDDGEVDEDDDDEDDLGDDEELGDEDLDMDEDDDDDDDDDDQDLSGDDELEMALGLASDDDARFDDDEDEDDDDENEFDDDDDDDDDNDDRSKPKTPTPAETPAASGAPGKYVPPALRNRTAAVAASAGPSASGSTLAPPVNEALKRQINGLINRVSAANLAVLTQELENVCLKNSRNEFSSILAQLLVEACVNSSRLLAHSLMVYAGLVAALHSVIGPEVSAQLLQLLVQQFNHFYEQGRDEGKQTTNIVLLLAYLYNFSVVHCRLVYDLVRKFVASLSELDVELLLVMLQAVGQQLRTDDPAALKDIIVDIQTSANRVLTTPAGQNAAATARLRVMLDLIYDLKNNKLSKLSGGRTAAAAANVEGNTMSMGTAAAAAQMASSDALKRGVKDLLSKRGKSSETELNVSLADLSSAGSRGRWWIVGAAWAGRGGANPESQPVAQPTTANTPRLNAKLQELARVLHMNTDIRRNVFTVLMTAEDYADAFEKLNKLGLKDKQEREIVKVIVECCLQENTYNPYYGHLSALFCSNNYNFKFTFQYTLWDRLKTLGEMNMRQLAHLARLFAFLINSYSLSLAVLKVVNFSELDARSIMFFRLFFVDLFTKSPADDETVRGVCMRLNKISELQGLKDGISLFLQHFMKNIDLLGLTEAAARQVKVRSTMVRQSLRQEHVF